MSVRCRIAILSWAFVALLPIQSALAIDLRIEPSILGQVRDGDGYFPGPTQVPVELYGDFGMSALPHGTTLDTYFRLEDDLANTQNSETDFFTGAIRVPSAPGNLDVQLGRQIVAESPVGLWDADSGQLRVGLGKTPFSLTVFGGMPQYWEPIFGPPVISQNEQIFGGSVRMASFGSGALSLGYLQQNRQGKELMQQITLSGTRAFTSLPGIPSLYGNFAYDADHSNIDRVRLGVQSFVWKPNLLLNFESGYYKPQDNGNLVIQDLNRREDPIFQLFSVSEELQFRGGLRYNLTRTVSAYGDLSYQRYQRLKGNYVNGYIWSTGLMYLPGGDGLESVRAEYYGIDSAGGTVNGTKIGYENRVYENILFRANFDLGYYQKATNQSGTAIASLIGLGYMILPGLVGELNFVANKNQFFPEDFRFGFFLTYSAGYSTRGGLHQDSVGNQWRPWPWAPAQFGPASWGPAPATWSANPSMPGSGWAASTFAAADATGQPAPAAGSGTSGGTGGGAGGAPAGGVQ
jgi:hypothetical protein